MLLKKGQWAQALGAYDKALPHVGNAGLSGGGNQLLTEDSSFSVDDPQPADLEADIHIAMGFSNVYSSSWVPGHWHPDRDLAEYRKALDLEPNSPLANLAYAHGLLEVGRNAEATTAFRAVVSKYDGDIKRSAEEELGIYRPSAPAPASPAAK
jgi:tetratricopeptide (TPR) repeat protein